MAISWTTFYVTRLEQIKERMGSEGSKTGTKDKPPRRGKGQQLAGGLESRGSFAFFKMKDTGACLFMCMIQ